MSNYGGEVNKMAAHRIADSNNGVSSLEATDALRVNAFINHECRYYRWCPLLDIDGIALGDDVNISSCSPL